MALVFCCTILGAAAQMLMKIGMQPPHARLVDYLSLTLLGGYCLYGISAALLTLALRDGELSLLYPVIALTYVWVTILSVPVLHERLNPFKLIGIGTIVIGVAVLGMGQKR